MLNLAARLVELSDEHALARLRARTFPPAKINDAFDLAEALLSSESIATALRARSRSELAALRALNEYPEASLDLVAEHCNVTLAELRSTVARLEALFLVTDTTRPKLYAEVAAALDLAGVPELAELSGIAEPVALAEHPVDTTLVDRWAQDAAVRATVALSELVWTLRTEPARELVKGGVALPDLKRLAAASGREVGEIDGLLDLARTAGLIAVLESEVVASSEADDWLRGTLAERWLRLVQSWWPKQLPEIRAAARHALALPPTDEPWRSRIAEAVHWLFPALEPVEQSRNLRAFERAAEVLGLLVSGELSELGRLSLSESGGLGQFAGSVFPTHIRSVYVQPDLSIIAPGPLEPALEGQLRSFCVVERAELAASYRLSVASVNRALANGANVSEMLALLEQLNDSPLPQPVRYLLEDAAARFGRVRVSEASAAQLPDLSVVHSNDRELIETIAADQSLAALALRRAGEVLLSRAPVRAVLWALTEDRYPAVLENARGEIVAAEPRQRAGASESGADAVAAAWQRVRAGALVEAGPEAFLARQIQQAIRAKSTLRVTVALPNGERKEYLLAPTALINGRLRGRDTAAEIERTLPLGSISALEAQ